MSDYQVATGQFTKSVPGSVSVAFDNPFLTPPLIFLTPSYAGADITFVDSVPFIDASGFTVNSPNCSNSAGPYIISWLAIAPSKSSE
jgi:hypothetical protein